LGNDTMNGAGGVDTASFLGFAAVNANLTTVSRPVPVVTRCGLREPRRVVGNDTLTGSAGANTIEVVWGTTR